MNLSLAMNTSDLLIKNRDKEIAINMSLDSVDSRGAKL